MKPKCATPNCYEESDCKHKLCADHCTRHHIHNYHSHCPKPRTKKPCLGIELEVEWRSMAARKRIISFDLEHDSSLIDGGELKLVGAWPSIRSRTIQTARDLSARGAIVSRSCGLHVHMDMRFLHYSQVERAILWAKSVEQDWFSLVPTIRRDGDYTRSLSRIWDRYSWLNFRSDLRTLECRLHPGTLNPYKLRAWLGAMYHLMSKIRDADYSFNKVSFNSFWKDAPPEVYLYVDSRRANGGVLTTRGEEIACAL